MLSPALLEAMQEFNPLEASIPNLAEILPEIWEMLKNLPQDSVARSGSRPMDYVYQWLFCDWIKNFMENINEFNSYACFWSL